MTDASIKTSPDGNNAVTFGVVILEEGKSPQTYSVSPPHDVQQSLSYDISDAELGAVLEGLTRCAIAGYDHVTLLTDNRGVISAMDGVNKVRSLKSLYIRDLIKRMVNHNKMRVIYKWRSRRHNNEADYMASRYPVQLQSSVPMSVFREYMALDHIPLILDVAGNPEFLRMYSSRVDTKIFMQRASSWQGVVLHRGIICATDQATSRAIAMAAGLLATAPKEQKSRITFNHMNAIACPSVTYGDLAAGWVWMVAKRFGMPSDRLVPADHIEALQEKRHIGYAMIADVFCYEKDELNRMEFA